MASPPPQPKAGLGMGMGMGMGLGLGLYADADALSSSSSASSIGAAGRDSGFASDSTADAWPVVGGGGRRGGGGSGSAGRDDDEEEDDDDEEEEDVLDALLREGQVPVGMAVDDEGQGEHDGAAGCPAGFGHAAGLQPEPPTGTDAMELMDTSKKVVDVSRGICVSATAASVAASAAATTVAAAPTTAAATKVAATAATAPTAPTSATTPSVKRRAKPATGRVAKKDRGPALVARCLDPRPGQTRYWTQAEHDLFLEAVAEHGEKAYVAISNHVETRTPKQVRTHAQKYQMKMARLAKSGNSPPDGAPPPHARGSGKAAKTKAARAAAKAKAAAAAAACVAGDAAATSAAATAAGAASAAAVSATAAVAVAAGAAAVVAAGGPAAGRLSLGAHAMSPVTPMTGSEHGASGDGSDAGATNAAVGSAAAAPNADLAAAGPGLPAGAAAAAVAAAAAPFLREALPLSGCNSVPGLGEDAGPVVEGVPVDVGSPESGIDEVDAYMRYIGDGRRDLEDLEDVAVLATSPFADGGEEWLMLE